MPSRSWWRCAWPRPSVSCRSARCSGWGYPVGLSDYGFRLYGFGVFPIFGWQALTAQGVHEALHDRDVRQAGLRAARLLMIVTGVAFVTESKGMLLGSLAVMGVPVLLRRGFVDHARYAAAAACVVVLHLQVVTPLAAHVAANWLGLERSQVLAEVVKKARSSALEVDAGLGDEAPSASSTRSSERSGWETSSATLRSRSWRATSCSSAAGWGRRFRPVTAVRTPTPTGSSCRFSTSCTSSAPRRRSISRSSSTRCIASSAAPRRFTNAASRWAYWATSSRPSATRSCLPCRPCSSTRWRCTARPAARDLEPDGVGATAVS